MDTSGAIVDLVEIRTFMTFINADPSIGPADPLALAEGFNDNHLTDFGGDGNPTGVFLVFENLDPNLLYDLTVVSAYDLRNLGTTFRINGDPATDMVVDTMSATPFVKYTDLAVQTQSPTEPNSINIHGFGVDVDVINAVRLEAARAIVPAPSALPAALVMAGMIGASRRRR